jgi:dihydrofolate synthase/folylpolyglutamate synthase
MSREKEHPEAVSERYATAIDYLYNLTKIGIKLGLENPRRLLRLLGNPETHFRSIHIAGTNGKGSTSFFIASILKQKDFKTGLFTSPHMVRFTERITIDLEEITEEEVVDLTEEIRRLLSESPDFTPTYFEVVTAIAFECFRRRGVQWAVVETGMGGRFDATNVLQPEISVITRVGIDHAEFLGNTIPEIAYEKAGIIKEAVPVVVGSQPPEAVAVIRAVAKEKEAPFYLFGEDFYSEIKHTDINGTIFDFYSHTLKTPLKELYIPLVGAHQTMNAAVAIQATVLALKKRYPEYSEENILQGFHEALKGSSLKGRTELCQYEGRWVLLDGAHNPEASEALADTLSQLYRPKYRRLILIIGVMSDKDIKGIVSPLVEISDIVVFTRPSYERSTEPDRLCDVALSVSDKKDYLITATVKEALDRAVQMASSDDLIVVTGSFYTVGEAKEALGERPLLSELREKR